MISFFFFVFAVYGSVHVYAFLKARNALQFGLFAGVVIAVFMLLMIFALFLVRALEDHDYEISARVLAYVAYFWMAVLFLFFCSSLLFDIGALLTRTVGWLTQTDPFPYFPSARLSFFICLCISLVINLYGYFEASEIRIEHVRIVTTKLPPDIDRITIAQITDVHLGLIVRHERLEKMLALVRSEKPDILVSTGDLVDAQINHLTGLGELLRGVKTPYGNYAITGNHEYYAGIEKALAFTRDSGFTVLRNEARDVGPITLVGVDDRTAVQMKLEKPMSERALLAKQNHDRFILFLKHQPRIDTSTIGLFDLQLSGHTHKGQIFPFTLLVRLTYPMIAGNYDLGRRSLLHVSRGTGTWGPPIRFLSPPEVTVIELVRKPAV
jgi:predicted MPP superfamily phosphohydrolase